MANAVGLCLRKNDDVHYQLFDDTNNHVWNIYPGNLNLCGEWGQPAVELGLGDKDWRLMDVVDAATRLRVDAVAE